MLDAIFNWDTFWVFLIILYVPACIGLIVIVLLQKGKGTGFAGAFGMGAGGADTVFGPKSSRTLPVTLTYVAAATFMIIALVMSIVATRVGKGQAPGLLDVDAADIGAVGGLEDIGIGRSVARILLPDDEIDDGEPASIDSSDATGEPAAPESDAATEEAGEGIESSNTQ